uniref:BSD domain-containing protein n=1 Tax=Globodera pallida TaxID=36090 RepID=A0A183CI67_GLOPA
MWISNHQQGFDVPSNASTGLDLIGSAATLILSQQQLLQQSGGDASAAASEDLLRADFSMPKLREFFECQKAMGVPNFPEDFDEFWLLVVKARLFNVFKYRGPEAYNRIVLKIRDIARQFRAQVEESERNEMAEQTKKEKTSS